MEFVIYFSKLERCEVIIKARPTRVIRYLAIVALCLLLGFMLGRKSKYEKRDYLKQFKIGKATYSESLIYEAYGGSGEFAFGFFIPWYAIVIAVAGVFVVVGISMAYSVTKVKKDNLIDELKNEND